MRDNEKVLDSILSRIADEICITATMQEKAISSYTAVGKWIDEGVDYDVKIMPQGSMNLGTVIKPIDDNDDYDVDLVCLLKNGQILSAKEIKQLVGNRLRENAVYAQKLDNEGKRCWTMQYDEFHMDILPCIPLGHVFVEPNLTAIKLTHKITSECYEFRCSDPYGYRRWFENQMKEVLAAEKRAFAAKNATEIDKVPTYRMRTPLQKVIQLLKRHRDICFQNSPEKAPISVIITTLAALSYNGESSVYEALCSILRKMPQNIEYRDGVYWVANPVISNENFAEKWNAEPQKRIAFFDWLRHAQTELINDPLSCYGLDSIAEKYKKILGEKPVQRAFSRVGEDTRQARENGNLYVSGLAGGVSATQGDSKIPVKEHTFWGE